MPRLTRRQRRRQARQAYDPLAPSFRTNRQFRRAVNRRADAQIQPLMAEQNRMSREQESRHTNRVGELDKWAQYNLGARTDAYGRVNTALNNLITGNAGLSEASQASLASALRGGAAKENQEAANLGVTGQVDPEAAIKAGAAFQDVGTLGTLGNLEAGRQASGRDIGIAGQAAQDFGTAETNRYGGVLDELDASRRELTNRIPGLRETARGAIQTEEQQKAAQAFQQGLAGKEFGLSQKQFRLQKRGQGFQERLAGRQQGETERATRESERIARQQIGISQEDLVIRREEIAAQAAIDLRAAQAAGDEVAIQEAKSRAKRFDNAATWLESYLKPDDSDYRGSGKDKKFSDKKYKARTSFNDAVRTIQSRFGLGERAALQVMGSTTNSGWAKEASKRLSLLAGQKNMAKYKKNRKGTGPD